MNVYIVGSVSMEDKIMCVAEYWHTALGCEVRYVKHEDAYVMDLIEKCFDTIENWADLVIVVPKKLHPVLELGDGTKYEMQFAKHCNKPVVIKWF